MWWIKCLTIGDGIVTLKEAKEFKVIFEVALFTKKTLASP
jgi:hypothetical protein